MKAKHDSYLAIDILPSDLKTSWARIVKVPHKSSWSFHNSFVRWAKSVACIDIMSITGREEPAKARPQAFFDHGFHHPTPDAPPTMRRSYIDVGQVGVTDAVRYRASKTNQMIAALDIGSDGAPRSTELEVDIFSAPPSIPVSVSG